MCAKQRGQATVEVVLLTPFLLVLVFLIFEFGRVFGSWLAITNAAREGARYGMTQTWSQHSCGGPGGTGGCTSADYNIQSRVAKTAQYLSIQNAGSSQGACQTNNQPPTGSISCIAISWDTDSSTNDHMVTVTAIYQVQPLMPITGNIPFVGAINYQGITVTGLTTMRTLQ